MHPTLLIKRMLITCFPILFIVSCDKGNSSNPFPEPPVDTGNYYIRVKSNGVSYEFKTVAEGTYNKKEGSWYNSQILGMKTRDVFTDNYVVLGFSTMPEYAVGTVYTNYEPAGGDSIRSYNAYIGFADNNGSGGQSFSDDPFFNHLPPHVKRDCRIKVTEATTSYVKGIFSGTLYYGENYVNQSALTEGEFYIKRKP